MTREELKAHCIRQIEQCEIWAKLKGEEPSGKIYEEHKLILELLDQEPALEIKTVTNTEEAKAYPISENITKGFEEFTKMMFKQGQAESEGKE